MRTYLLLSFVLLCCAVIGDVSSWPKNTSPSITYRTKQKDLVLRLMVHVDYVASKKMVAQYKTTSRRKMKSFIANVLEDARKLLSHPSLGQTVRFKVLGVRFLRQNRLMMNEDATKYLASYCNWESGKKTKTRHFSILLTGLDLYYMNTAREKFRRLTGRGYANGMCSIRKSCTLLEWDDKNVAYLLAHEIGHSLSINHDGQNNHCKEQKHIMTAKYDEAHHPKTWSSCSRLYIKQYLQSRKSWCIIK